MLDFSNSKDPKKEAIRIAKESAIEAISVLCSMATGEIETSRVRRQACNDILKIAFGGPPGGKNQKRSPLDMGQMEMFQDESETLKEEIIDVAKEHAPEASRQICLIMQGKSSPNRARRQACNDVIKIAFGSLPSGKSSQSSPESVYQQLKAMAAAGGPID